jgi:hypothetical protein
LGSLQQKNIVATRDEERAEPHQSAAHDVLSPGRRRSPCQLKAAALNGGESCARQQRAHQQPLIGARLFALNGAQPYLALDRSRIGPRPVERIKHAVADAEHGRGGRETVGRSEENRAQTRALRPRSPEAPNIARRPG